MSSLLDIERRFLFVGVFNALVGTEAGLQGSQEGVPNETGETDELRSDISGKDDIDGFQME